jgi:ribosomal 50S subunit-associated protein YjgA (DUF615 family)
MPQENDIWERGKDALEILLQSFPVSDLEKLAKLVQEKPEYVGVLSQLLQQQEM